MQVRPVHSGTATLKDATSEAIRDWVTNVETTHYILGSAAGPHPYPMMVRAFHPSTSHPAQTLPQFLPFGEPGKPLTEHEPFVVVLQGAAILVTQDKCSEQHALQRTWSLAL